MKPKKTAMIMFSATIVMALSASGAWAGKAGQTTPSIVKQKCGSTLIAGESGSRGDHTVPNRRWHRRVI